MGFRVSWVARRGSSSAELLDAVGCKLTGERHKFPDVGFYLLQLPGDEDGPWSVLIADGSENFTSLSSTHAESQSLGGESIYFWCSDTSMSTEMSCHRNGRRVWAIEYDCEDEKKRPLLDGDIPPVAKTLLAALEDEQRVSDEEGGGADHIYDLTAALGRALVGFRHDADAETDDPEPYQVLAHSSHSPDVAAAVPRPWWKFWRKQSDGLSVEVRLEQALSALLGRTNNDAFVILEDVRTERFVQFGAGSRLVLDLPLVSLQDDEQERAHEVFRRLGAPPAAMDPFPVLRFDFGTDSRRAAEEAVRVFREVYHLKSPQFALQEN